nr:MAG TPA: hypothetical protein [Caudoviricetes sp.]
MKQQNPRCPLWTSGVLSVTVHQCAWEYKTE